jgi:hypothetical protein
MTQHLPFPRLRVSTVLLLCGLCFLPWALYWLPPPTWGSTAYAIKIFYFVAYSFSAQLIFFGALLALASVPWFAHKKNWWGLFQAVLEFLLGLSAAIALPSY